ncbi:MAG: polysaccharide export protein [Deltaproteobacteria bacterium]|nr:polysaccharide export protein [Deltaproteobacteria bacterium]MBW2017846.1 polysaccharide export protein [Deltaproteobacteria bacterium]MBW2129617.1 polysaccharide export protein [Deltaproteobacteria bacterium]MBW2305145.1 polysaccharide export protein [Deltaproteobacteria bacterium]
MILKAFSPSVAAEPCDPPGREPESGSKVPACTYRIGPGDLIEVSIWRDENLTREILVPPDGVISFPLIEEIEVTSLTVPQLREKITRKICEYIPDATVTVILLKANSLMAYVIGKVNQPGRYPITLNTNVMQILAMAGGLNPFAAPKKILILRVEGGKTLALSFNYDQVKKGENLEQNILLKRGDVVVVP